MESQQPYADVMLDERSDNLLDEIATVAGFGGFRRTDSGVALYANNLMYYAPHNTTRDRLRLLRDALRDKNN